MLEKNSSIIITPDERRKIEAGILPDRLSRDWGLSLAEAKAIIQSSETEHPTETKSIGLG